MDDLESAILVFGMRNQLAEQELDSVEREFAIDLGRGFQRQIDSDESYYPQIESSIRREAARMAPHYEVFYSLEKTIRALVADSLESEEGEEWWESGRIPEKIKTDAEGRQLKEIEAAVTPRSEDPIDFTTFGELGQIIINNWDVFEQTFTSRKAVERVTANLNTLRGPVAHCSPFADDEVVRLRLSVRDWFRLQA